LIPLLLCNKKSRPITGRLSAAVPPVLILCNLAQDSLSGAITPTAVNAGLRPHLLTFQLATSGCNFSSGNYWVAPTPSSLEIDSETYFLPFIVFRTNTNYKLV